MTSRPVEASWRGLTLVGTYSSERGSRECPPSETAHLVHVLCDDAEAGALEGAPADVTARVLEWGLPGILPSGVEFWLVRKYEDEIDAALCAAGREAEDAGDRDDN